MAGDGWNFFATTINGADGTETLLAADLPLSDTRIGLALSAPTSLDATISVEHPSLPDLVPFKTAVYAELDGVIRGAGILKVRDEAQTELGLSCVGWTSYLAGQPWPGNIQNIIDGDPFDVAKLFWNVAQSPAGANIGLQLDFDPEETPIRLGQLPPSMYKQIAVWTPYTLDLPKEGTPFVALTDKSKKDERIYGLATRDFTPASTPKGRSQQRWLVMNKATKKMIVTQAMAKLDPALVLVGKLSSSTAPTNPDGSELAPWPLTWFDVADMLARWDDLAKDGGFDYLEDHRWTSRPQVLLPGDRVGISHTLRLGWPQIGRRRNDLRFVVGENVIGSPAVEFDGDFYADVIEVRGAGQGAAMKHAQWPVPNTSGRLRRVKVFTDTAITSTAGCEKRAQQLARAYADESNMTSVAVDPRYPNGWAWGFGDLITVQGGGKGWAGDRTMTVRILGADITPDTGDTITLKTSRSERVTNG